MLDTFSQIDTPLEWEESAIALLLLFAGFIIGTFVATKVFKLLSGIFLVGVSYWIMYEITQSYWADWKQIIIAALLIGIVTSFLVVPFSITAEFENRISKLEKE